MYRLIISEKSKDPYGRNLEILGSYNPFTKELVVKKDRIEHWIANGSGMSITVNNLLIEKGIIKGEKIKSSSAKTKKKGGKEEEKKETPTEEKPVEEKKEEVVAKEEVKEELKEETPKENK
ncbi:30S ribosomal protein S16 [Candidatus Falkowbacteria bacterium RIFOXYB2_FULL_34_18]|nr:MAG: 30S ribosomal protein S16 [Candidatus Falkowbacteria bacterium RIFOXYB2_FULL_34_18]